MDTAPWPQGIVVKPMDEIVVTNTVYQKPPTPPPSSISERKVRTQKDHYHHQQALKCPRCNSTNTKFCYYNNYSLSQPRFFCKTCRRYWTEGGSLRNIPVGGGSRKNKRSHNSSSSSSSTSAAIDTSSSSKKLPGNNLVLPPPHIAQQNPNNKIHGNTPQDLNLGYAATNPDEDDDDHGFKSLSEMIQVQNSSAASDHSLSNISAMELLTGFTGSRGLDNSGFVPLTMTGTIGTNADHQQHHHPNAVYSTGLPLSADEFMKQPSLSFSLDGLGNNYGSFQGVRENSGKILFPFEDLKHRVSSESANGTADQKENGTRHGDNSSTAGFWNGVIGGGSW